MLKTTALASLIFRKAGRHLRKRAAPTTRATPEGLLDPPRVTLERISDAWRCWRCFPESERAFLLRLQVHLQAIQIAVEDDLARVLAIEKQLQTPPTE